MRRILISLLAVAALLGMTSTTAFAHGGHGQGGHGRGHHKTAAAQQQAHYAPCTQDGCEILHNHQHGDTWYCARDARYEICTEEGCTAIGPHEHDGTYYRCKTPLSVGGRGRVHHQR